MIQEMLPTGISCPRETRDLLLDCCVGNNWLMLNFFIYNILFPF